ncbi:LysR family transcriptional regulator [Cupriavidus sp. WS]|uniref:LysR family transcriptional regulator n=1 Tax=Cupriavidus sp. WS TaxID=1312922 RepID=UPI0003753A16|nr:LysR family transcriptional regulator [Cupriavidus sp. WS]
MDRFDAMRVFACVVETGSFTKASETLHISRATATQLVQQLETRLHAKLLHRTTRKVKVTVAGQTFYDHAIRLLADLQEAERGVAGGSDMLEGRLRVDVPSPLASLILVPALPGFYERYPGIQLDMRVSDRTSDLLDENIDCVIRGGPIADQTLIARRVGDLHLQTYAAPEYLRRAGNPGHPSELDGSAHRIVGYLWAHRNQRVPYPMRRGEEIVSIRGNYALAVDDGNAYLAAGVAGLGIVWLPDYMAQRCTAEGTLIRLFPEWQLDPMPLHVAFHPSRRANARLRAFIDWVEERIGAIS